FAPETRSIRVAADTPAVEFRLEPGHTIRGRLLDPAGKPIEGVEVGVDTWRQRRSLLLQLKTDADGRFVWSDAPADELTMEFKKSGYIYVAGHRMLAADQEQTITMYPYVQVQGSVTDAATGRPIEE